MIASTRVVVDCGWTDGAALVLAEEVAPEVLDVVEPEYELPVIEAVDGEEAVVVVEFEAPSTTVSVAWPWEPALFLSPEYWAMRLAGPGVSPKTSTVHAPWAREHPAGAMLTDPLPLEVHVTLPLGLDPVTVEVHWTDEPTATNVAEQVRESRLGPGAGGLPRAIRVPFSADRGTLPQTVVPLTDTPAETSQAPS